MGIELRIMSMDLTSNEGVLTRKIAKQEISIGRNDDNDVILNRFEVSAHHARIRVKEEKGHRILCITDLGSANGIAVEGKTIPPKVEVTFSSNERILIGRYLLKAKAINETREERSTGKLPPREKREMLASILSDVELVQSENGSSSKSCEVTGMPCSDEAELEVTQLETEISEAEVVEAAEKPELPETDEQIVLNFDAIRVFCIRGVVLRKGQGLEGVKIDGGILGHTISDSEGKFLFDNVIESTGFSLSASKTGYAFEAPIDSGSLESDQTLTFNATKLCVVTGKVSYQGAPLAGVEIDAGVYGSTTTSEDGSYRFENIPEGSRVVVKPVKSGYKFASNERSRDSQPHDLLVHASGVIAASL